MRNTTYPALPESGELEVFAMLRHVLAAFPKSKFIHSLISQILADNQATPAELARLRSAVALQNAINAAKGLPRAEPGLAPAPARAPEPDPQALAFDELAAMILQFGDCDEVLALAASVLEDGLISAAEMQMISQLHQKLEFRLHNPRLDRLRALLRPREKNQAPAPEPGCDPLPQPEPAPKEKYVLPAIFEFPVPRFGPETSRRRGEED